MHIHWLRVVRTQPAIPHLPRLLRLGLETVTDKHYVRVCARRDADAHTLITWTIGGQGEVRDRAGNHSLAAGQAFMTRINDPEVAYYYPPQGQAPWHFCYAAVEMDPRLSEALLAHCGRVFSFSQDRLQPLLAWGADQADQVTIGPQRSYDLVAGIISNIAATAAQKGVEDPLIAGARDVVAAHLQTGIRVDAIAHALGVSSGHLSRRFRAVTGHTLRDWIRQERMRLARDLLGDQRRSVRAVAELLGYPSAGHLSRSYRAVYGCTPQQGRLR